MPVIDVYGERKHQQVMRETWGHLAPEPRRSYRGYIVMTHTEWRTTESIAADFDGLDSSPWFYEDLSEYVDAVMAKKSCGSVYRFDGTYTKFKNGGYRFSGRIRRVRLGPSRYVRAERKGRS